MALTCLQGGGQEMRAARETPVGHGRPALKRPGTPPAAASRNDREITGEARKTPSLQLLRSWVTVRRRAGSPGFVKGVARARDICIDS